MKVLTKLLLAYYKVHVYGHLPHQMRRLVGEGLPTHVAHELLGAVFDQQVVLHLKPLPRLKATEVAAQGDPVVGLHVLVVP